MRRSGERIGRVGGEPVLVGVTCESVGHTPEGRAIWKEVGDAHECYVIRDGLFWPYDPDELDGVGDLYGTYVDDAGERVGASAAGGIGGGADAR